MQTFSTIANKNLSSSIFSLMHARLLSEKFTRTWHFKRQETKWRVKIGSTANWKYISTNERYSWRWVLFPDSPTRLNVEQHSKNIINLGKIWAKVFISAWLAHTISILRIASFCPIRCRACNELKLIGPMNQNHIRTDLPYSVFMRKKWVSLLRWCEPLSKIWKDV